MAEGRYFAVLFSAVRFSECYPEQLRHKKDIGDGENDGRHYKGRFLVLFVQQDSDPQSQGEEAEFRQRKILPGAFCCVSVSEFQQFFHGKFLL